jgi:hypothetical protein
MKLRPILIIAAGILLLQYEWAAAANLSKVRTGKHENFARIVFQFQSAVQFKKPEIKGKGKFSLVFPNSTTSLPHLTVFKTGKTQLVRSVEYIRQESNLTAVVSLTFPYFILKSYALSAPDRVVVDAYWMSPPTENPEQKESLPKASVTESSASPDKEETNNMLQNAPEKPVPESAVKPLTVKKTALSEPQTSQNTVSNRTSNQLPEKKKMSPSPSKGHTTAQTYLLAVLDVIAGCIVVLLILALFNKKPTINIGHLCEILDFIKTSDKRIADIDAEIQSAFKKYDQS